MIGYMIDKEILFIFGIPIYLIMTVIRVLLKKKKSKKINLFREITGFAFTVYILALVGVTLLPIEIIFKGGAVHASGTAINYIPFQSIARDVAEVGRGHFSTAFQIELLIKNVGGNFILLMPLGFLLPILSNKVESIKKILIIGFAVSLSIELFQLLEDYSGLAFARIVDIDDIILNTSGAVLGYIIYFLINSIIRKYKIEVSKEY